MADGRWQMADGRWQMADGRRGKNFHIWLCQNSSVIDCLENSDQR
ncbi:MULTISPECIES: hypothetical protein [Fischerella]|nr:MULTISPECIES: hypothetical protein [Fischerella]